MDYKTDHILAVSLAHICDGAMDIKTTKMTKERYEDVKKYAELGVSIRGKDVLELTAALEAATSELLRLRDVRLSEYEGKVEEPDPFIISACLETQGIEGEGE